jgi:hypothetical protein
MLSANEEQELEYLEVFITNKIERFFNYDFPKELKDSMGSGADKIIKNFIRDGVITDLEINSEYEFNKVGKNRYCLLKRKKLFDRIMNIIVWLTFFAVIISLFYIIAQYYKDDATKYQQLKKEPIKQEQPKLQTYKLLQHDTIKAHKNDSVEKK